MCVLCVLEGELVWVWIQILVIKQVWSDLGFLAFSVLLGDFLASLVTPEGSSFPPVYFPPFQNKITWDVINEMGSVLCREAGARHSMVLWSVCSGWLGLMGRGGATGEAAHWGRGAGV